LNCARWASANARRFATFRQPVVAHVALANDAAFRVVLGYAVRTIPGAVLAADAGFSVVNHDSRNLIFRISINGTAGEARRFQTMVTTHRQMQALRVRVPAAFDFTDAPPIDVCGISVLLVASDNATLAPDTLRHVKVKTVLLANFQGSLGNARCGMVNGSGAVRCADRD
jgi:hypothetical protein